MHLLNKQKINISFDIPTEIGGNRLDQVAALLFEDYSRSRLTTWIKSGALTVDGQSMKPKTIVYSGMKLSLTAELDAQGEWIAEDIPINIVYEDEHILVVNKPAGLVVHPAAGHASGTLLNALLHYYPNSITIPRAGIVHRLDKDTTGLMVVAKSLQAQTSLVEQMQRHSVSRVYECIVNGVVIAGSTVKAAIGRSPTQRQRMAVVDGGKMAVSHYRVLQRFRSHTHIRVLLETGRTHQIRVHMQHEGFPLVGDITYGGRFRIPAAADVDFVQYLKSFPRQALHARFLELDHPVTGDRMRWESSLPDEMMELLDRLEEDKDAFSE